MDIAAKKAEINRFFTAAKRLKKTSALPDAVLKKYVKAYYDLAKAMNKMKDWVLSACLSDGITFPKERYVSIDKAVKLEISSFTSSEKYQNAINALMDGDTRAFIGLLKEERARIIALAVENGGTVSEEWNTFWDTVFDFAKLH